MTWSPHAVTSPDVASASAVVKSPIASAPAAHANFTPPCDWPANSFVFIFMFYRRLTLLSAPSNPTESLAEILAVVRE